jgi:UDP-glucuronate 4-epimerase
LPIVCLRFFTVYGPRQRPDLAIRKFIDMIAAGKPISVFGDGSSSRDYTFVEDTVSGIMAAIDHDCRYDIFNLGNSRPVSLLTLIRTIEEAVGRTAEIRWMPQQPGDVPITFADITKARRLLGYEPQTLLRDGIPKAVEWSRSRAALITASSGR